MDHGPWTKNTFNHKIFNIQQSARSQLPEARSNPPNPKTILLISGTSGFLGTNLVNYLKDYQINSLQRGEFDKPIAPEVAAVIHLAGKAHDVKNTSGAEAYFEVNTQLSIQLFERFLQSNAERFIFISSVKAAADRVHGVLTEDMPCAPETPYGQSKYQAELALEKLLGAHRAQHPQADKQLYILRPCMIHGPGNKGNLNLLYQMIAKGIPYPLGAFENQRSFLSVENICFVIKEILDRPIAPGTYQVADNLPLSTNELIALMAQAMGKKANIWNINPAFINALAKLGNILHLPLNTSRLQKLTESYVVSNTKLITALGKPLPVESKQGLLKTVLSFRF